MNKKTPDSLNNSVKPFAIAFWFCPTCGHLTSEIELTKEQTNDENKWHKAASVIYNSATDRAVVID